MFNLFKNVFSSAGKKESIPVASAPVEGMSAQEDKAGKNVGHKKQGDEYIFSARRIRESRRNSSAKLFRQTKIGLEQSYYPFLPKSIKITIGV